MNRWLRALPRHDRNLVIATMAVCVLCVPMAWVATINDGKLNRWANESFGTSFDVSPRRFKESRLDYIQ